MKATDVLKTNSKIDIRSAAIVALLSFGVGAGQHSLTISASQIVKEQPASAAPAASTSPTTAGKAQ